MANKGACIGCAVLTVGGFGFILYKFVFVPVGNVVSSVSAQGMDTVRQLEQMKKDGKFAPSQHETYEISGDPTHVDPFALVKEIRPKIGDNTHLYSIEAKFVRSDGTMDLNADYQPEPTIKYKFYREVKNDGAKLPPVGAGRSVGDVWLERTQVECSHPGEEKHYVSVSGRHNSSVYYTNKGMDFDRSQPYMNRLDPDLGDPKVTTASLWKTALEKGAPKDAVATIVYNMNGYHFSINGSQPDLYFDIQGKLKH